MAYTHHTTTEEHPMRRTLASMTVTAIASASLLMPAAAFADDDPLPGPETDPCGIVWRDREIAYWRNAIDEQRDTLLAREAAATGRALLAEDRAAELADQVAARTTERDQALVRVARQGRAIVRLQDKVAELRARIRQEPVG